MRERPEKWEVICKQCFCGLIMSDKEVARRLNSESTWPKHCGKSMSIRHILQIPTTPIKCSHFGCHLAQNAKCSCDCEGRYHGVKLEYREYAKPIVAEKQWYKKPIREYIEVSPL